MKKVVAVVAVLVLALALGGCGAKVRTDSIADAIDEVAKYDGEVSIEVTGYYGGITSVHDEEDVNFPIYDYAEIERSSGEAKAKPGSVNTMSAHAIVGLKGGATTDRLDGFAKGDYVTVKGTVPEKQYRSKSGLYLSIRDAEIQ